LVELPCECGASEALTDDEKRQGRGAAGVTAHGRSVAR
jgi:hypothetical protein